MALQEELETQGNFLFKYRGILPLFILLVAVLIIVLETHAHASAFVYQTFTPVKLAALAVCLLGLAIRVYTVGHTPKHTSGRNTEEQVADVLNTSGIYSIVRHPLYVGNFFMWLGVGVLTENWWFLAAFVFMYWVYYERIMFAEEQFLRRKFGAAYLQWANATPAFLPSFTNWKKPAVKFSWAKVIKKEKNGLLAIFICFYAIDVLQQSVAAKQLVYQTDFWLYAVIASTAWYFVVKLLRKYSTVLNEE